MTARLTVTLLMAVSLSLPGLIHSFQPLFTVDGKSSTHLHITQRAVLRKTAEVCRDIAASEGRDFSLTIDDSLSADSVQRACSSTGGSFFSSLRYYASIAEMYFSNAKVDVAFALSEKHHFDSETFQKGRDLITSGVAAVKSSVKSDNFVAGRWILGQVCHTLQDFYSHSNWVELGNTAPYSALITPDQPLENLAGSSVPTCRNCKGQNCADNLLPDLLQQGLLTSGYFNVFSSEKPQGKCSHGGFFDKTSNWDPVGGINKDSIGSSHGSLHHTAADLAVIATMELLEDIRLAVGDQNFLQLMGLSQSSALCFITKSTVKSVAFDIDSKRGTEQELCLSELQVTVLEVVKNPGKPDNFTFTVDGSLKNIIVYIKGASSLTFKLRSPTGLSQSSSETSGPLASSTATGNLRRLSLNADNQTGSWQITVNSNSPYSVKVAGQSSVNFLYNLVEAHEGVHADFSLKEGRPLSGSNVSLMISVTGSDIVKVTGVTLFSSSGSTEVDGSLQALGGGNFFVAFTGIPAGEFEVLLKGEDSNSATRSTTTSFQRQASTRIKTSSISVTTQVTNINIEPGSTVSVPFTVAATSNGVVNDSATGTFTLRANNDRSYASTSPSTVTVAAGSGGTANGTVTLTVPSSAASGTGVTLTIEAENVADGDINYAVVRFSVTAKVTDFSRPVCQEVRTTSNCSSSSSSCSSSQWEFVANFTDGVNGTGIENVNIRKGKGTLSRKTTAGEGGEEITVVTFSASCCKQTVELTAIDKVGNVATCVGQVRVKEMTAPAPANRIVANTTSTGGHTWSLAYHLWIIVAVSLLWN
ncbi:von Willebrand factor A domain-containing protein 7-like [Solea solea]|uniref:von Willebrand factor A domain-containing protein 7-like n=1 Tax=Solea solea TaxID=90069 RepID=UPI00272D5470|nr:von Willebrand factor A domain-containing protein 7-like [Solea solea]